MTPFLGIIVGVAGLVLAAFFIWLVKALVTSVARFNHFFWDWTGEAERPGVPARPGVMARLEKVEAIMRDTRAEVFRNGGDSLRDAVDQVGVNVTAHRQFTAPAIMQVSTDVVTVLDRINELEDDRVAREEGTQA